MEKRHSLNQYIHDIQSKILLLYENAFSAARMHNIALAQSCIEEIDEIYFLWHKAIFQSLHHPRSLPEYQEKTLYEIELKKERLKHYF